MRDRGLDQRHHLLAVAAERARDERAAKRQRDRAGIDRLERVDRALLLDRAEVGRRRELALGQAVNAIVLDDVDQREIAPHHVHELPDTDRRRVAIARDSNAPQRFIRQQGAGGNGRHAAVDAVESVRQSQEIRR